MYYRSIRTNHIFGERDAELMRGAFGSDQFDHDVKEGLIEILDPPPTVIDLLKNRNEVLAIMRYVEIHSTEENRIPLRKAKQMVDRIKKDMERIRSKHTDNK